MKFEIVQWNEKYFVRKKSLFFYFFLDVSWSYGFSWLPKFLLEDYHGLDSLIEANVLISNYVNEMRNKKAMKKKIKVENAKRKNPMKLVDEVYHEI